MSNQSFPSILQPSIELEFIPEDALQQDLSDVTQAGQNIVDNLIRSGCTVVPVYTGKMGVGFVYDILIMVQNNGDLLASLLASLTAVLNLISEHSRREEEKKSSLTPAPVSIEIDLPTEMGPITIKAPDAQTALMIIEELQRNEPEKLKKITPQDKPKIKAGIPWKKWLRQR